MGGCARSGWAASLHLMLMTLMHCSAAVRELHLSPLTRRFNHTVPANLSSAVSLEYLNHEVYGGLYSQLVYGESFEELATQVRGGSSSIPILHGVAHAMGLGWWQPCGECKQQLCVRNEAYTSACRGYCVSCVSQQALLLTVHSKCTRAFADARRGGAAPQARSRQRARHARVHLP